MLPVVVVVVGCNREVGKVFGATAGSGPSREGLKPGQILLLEPGACALTRAVRGAFTLTNLGRKKHALRRVGVRCERVTLRAVDNLEVCSRLRRTIDELLLLALSARRKARR